MQDEQAESKYLDFFRDKATMKKRNMKTQVWKVLSKRQRTLLATVRWFTQWRRYCWIPETDIVWSTECTDDLNNFVKRLNKERTFDMVAKKMNLKV